MAHGALMRGVLTLPILGCVLAAVASCAPTSEEPIASLDDALSTQDFDTTVKNLGALPWLPWAYTADGCYARAAYYSMLLATRGVPTNHLYAVAKQGTSLAGIWGWHVAPLVTRDGDPDHLYVLDPVYDQTRALTSVEWIARQGFALPGASDYPHLHVHPGTSYFDQNLFALTVSDPEHPDADRYREPSFSVFPRFDVFVVGRACKTMHQYIDREPGTTAEGKTEKHTSLGRETKRLVRALADRGKLEGEPQLYRNCTRDPTDPPDPGDGWGGWGTPSAEPATPAR